VAFRPSDRRLSFLCRSIVDSSATNSSSVKRSGNRTLGLSRIRCRSAPSIIASPSLAAISRSIRRTPKAILGTVSFVMRRRHGRGFWCNCRSALPDVQTLVPAGSLNNEARIRPRAHIFVSSRAAWDDALEQVPRDRPVSSATHPHPRAHRRFLRRDAGACTTWGASSSAP
jgi:hypothetical protein